VPAAERPPCDALSPPEPEPGSDYTSPSCVFLSGVFLSSVSSRQPPFRGAIMLSISPEQLCQRIGDAGILDARQFEALWAKLGTREVSLDALTGLLLRDELLTNYQLDKLLKGEKGGYFYGEYKVLYLVGTGTFARVYRAVHGKTGRIVCVKALRKRFRDDKAMCEQFLREGKIGVALRHPCIVPIYEVSEHPSPSLVMEFVEGSNLREFQRMRKKMMPLESMRLTVDILAGLVYAFQQGMTHRDLKMSNVLVTSRGRGKLVDFGLAGLQTNNTSGSEETNPRTIDYAALERACNSKNNDPRSDLFFVGAMLYNMIAGVSPIGDNKDRLSRQSSARFQNIKPIQYLEPTVPGRLAAFIMRSLELVPSKRYGTAQEMHDDARRILVRLEAGDLSDADANESPADLPKALKLPSDHEGANKTIMVVESKIEMQNVLRDRLKKYGYRVLIFSDPRRAIRRFIDDDHQPADCVLFCAEHLGVEALESFNEMSTITATKDVPALLFVDGQQKSLIKAAQLAPHRVLLSTPLKVRELRDALVKLLQPGDAPAGVEQGAVVSDTPQ
jgi:serine/threonine protein kinase